MNIQTAYFGEIEIDPTTILHFEHGIPGFEDEKQFVLLPIGDNSIYQAMQSVNTQDVAFTVTSPYAIDLDYAFDLDEPTMETLAINEQSEIAVIVIVSLKDTLADSTVNLKAPVVINITNKQAKQVILNTDEYNIRHPLTLLNEKSV